MNGLGIKLGKRAKRHDERTLRLARYLTGAGQAQTLKPPASVDYTHGLADWGLMLNDQLGCCTIAAIGHAVQAWTFNALGREVTVPDSTILRYYEQWDGYDPSNPASDQGGVELDVLNAWRKNKFAGHALEAYVAIALDSSSASAASASHSRAQKSSPAFTRRSSASAVPSATTSALPNAPSMSTDTTQNTAVSSLPQIATAIWLFGGAYIGLELPITAQKQDVWDLPAEIGADDEPGSWGGHAVYLVGYEFRDAGPGVRDSGLGVRDSGLGARVMGGVNSGDTQLAPSGTATTIPDSEFRIPDAVTQPESPSSGLRQTPVELANGIRVPSPDIQVPNPDSPTLTCITWGKPKKMTLAWFEKYCSEAYALVSTDWLESSGIAPCGFDLAALEKDLAIVTDANCRQTAA